MLQAIAVEKIKTYIFKFNNFLYENRAVYEVMWKNTAGQATDDNTARALFMLNNYGC
jgi:hypothetical protein